MGLIVYIILIVIGILALSNAIPLGVLFLASTVLFLYCIFVMLNKDSKLSTLGIISIISSLICGVYSGITVFGNVDIIEKIFSR